MVAPPAEHVVGGLVGGVQQIGHAQASGSGGGTAQWAQWAQRDRSWRHGDGHGHGRTPRCGNGWGKRRRVRADNTRKIRSAPSRSPVLHRLGGCAGVVVAPCGGACCWSLLVCPRAVTAAEAASRTPRRRRRADRQERRVRCRPVRSASPHRCDDESGRSRRLDRRRVFPGLPCRQGVDGRPAGLRPRVIEPYLGMVQASPSGVAGTWNVRWSDLSPARQSAVIVAASAAANGECG